MTAEAVVIKYLNFKAPLSNNFDITFNSKVDIKSAKHQTLQFLTYFVSLFWSDSTFPTLHEKQ